MKNYLVVMLQTAKPAGDEKDHARYLWAAVVDGVSRQWHSGGLAELTQNYTGEAVIIIAPAERFRFVRAALPGKSRPQLELAARYSLEDDIASEIETVEVFVSDEQHNGAYTVAIVDKEYLEGFITPLVNEGMDVRKITPDALLLNHRANAAEILIENDRCLVRYDATLAAAFNIDVASQLLTKLQHEHNFDEVHCLISGKDAENNNLLETLQGLDAKDAAPSIQTRLLKQPANEYLLDRIVHAEGEVGIIDLVPKRFKNSKTAVTRKRLWWIAAGIFAVAVAMQVVLDWWQINQAQQQILATRDSQQSLIKSSFPEIGRIVNPEAQVQRALGALEKTGPPPAEFLTILTQSLTVPTRTALQIDLTGMTFADGVLLLRTESKEMGDLEKYRADLNKMLTAEVVTAESTEEAVRGAIRISK